MALSKLLYYFRVLPLRKALPVVGFYGLRKLLNPYSKVFFSQHGEDGLIQHFIGEAGGFYVDVGCNHPVKESNTYRFYLQGWNGLCIDASPNLVQAFKRVRPKDKMVCAAVSDKAEELDFFEFNQDTVSTVDKNLVAERKKRWGLKKVRTLKARTLNDILQEAYPLGCPQIGLLSIDIEGYSLQALHSLDLKKYKPRLIVIEIDDFDFYEAAQNPTVAYLIKHHYRLEAFDSKNGYFILEGQR